MSKIVKRQFDGYVIESGIPIMLDPAKSKDRWFRLVNAMEVGDSTVLKTSGDVCSFRSTCKKLGFECKSRAIRDVDGKASPDVRVWKLDKYWKLKNENNNNQ
jgi:hypothetical protein